MKPIVVDASVWVSAADASDSYHDASREFLRAVVHRGVSIVVPAIARLEVACAMGQRLRDGQTGRAMGEQLAKSPLVRELAINAALLRDATDQGTAAFLRSGDSLYVAAARRSDATLVSNDDELIRRADAVSPEQWLALL